MKRLKMIKKAVLWAITFVMVCLYMFAFLAVGTGLTEYKTLLCVSMVWFALFFLANGGMKIIKDAWYL